jgi:hypothetical protein
LGFQTGTPRLVFERVFDFLSPGFLWHHVRWTCRAWKDLVEENILHSLRNYALLQLIMSKSVYPSADGNFSIHHTVYRLTKYHFKRNSDADLWENCVLTFTPLKDVEAYSVTDRTWTQWHVHADWKILDIVSPIFPGSWKQLRPLNPYYMGHPSQYYLSEDITRAHDNALVTFFDPEIHRSHLLTQKDIDTFNSLLPASRDRQTRHPTMTVKFIDGQWFPRSKFANPEVDFEITVGGGVYSSLHL